MVLVEEVWGHEVPLISSCCLGNEPVLLTQTLGDEQKTAYKSGGNQAIDAKKMNWATFTMVVLNSFLPTVHYKLNHNLKKNPDPDFLLSHYNIQA